MGHFSYHVLFIMKNEEKCLSINMTIIIKYMTILVYEKILIAVIR